jgi:hypothetical protein
MTLPFSFPPWVPWWVPVVVLVPALLYGLFFLAMPFGVFGLKSRLDALEARLDEIQGEIRALVLRLPERDRGDFETPPRARTEAPPRPPIPPAPVIPHAAAPRPADRDDPDGGFRIPPIRADRDEPRRRAPPPSPAPSRRSEPRIDWPRPNP